MSELSTARRITNALYWSLRGASDLMIPRFTPLNWWECDMWRLTNAGFVDEYEIKLSVQDFAADIRKSRDETWEKQPDGRYGRTPGSGKLKHDLLAQSEEGPNRFWFVMPSELAERVTIPAYAGLIISNGLGASVSISAPKRHGRKWGGNKQHLLKTFYYRYWNHEAGTQSEIEPFKEEFDHSLLA